MTMEEKLDLSMQISELQLNLVDLLMEVNRFKTKYENNLQFNNCIENIENNKVFSNFKQDYDLLKIKFEDFKLKKNENNKLDLYKCMLEEFDFIRDDLTLIKSFNNNLLDEQTYLFCYCKLVFATKNIELMYDIISQMNV